ncbi:hypothetical protein HYW94_03920 [Candidatus Uhrbacteria bacterium]|nr:hypothetical protein [Candidatus Uhrbacteria bacterium]
MHFFYKQTCGLSNKDIQKHAKKLFQYRNHLKKVRTSHAYADTECSLTLPYDESHARISRALAQQKATKALKYIFVIGIGGSNLGTKAVYDACRGYHDVCGDGKFPKMIFLDTVDPEILVAYQKLLATIRSPEEILINIISKSGGTTETILNAEYVYAWLKKKFPAIHERIVVTTDEDSSLWKESMRKHIACLSIPGLVGGRYSVFSSVGLFPLAAGGFDISSLLAGARGVLDRCLGSSIQNDIGLISAAILFSHAKKTKDINDNFFFHPELESVGRWYRQLLGESIGKEAKNGARAGITPTISLGSVDLHSVGQLYLGGPRDKVTTFVYTDIVTLNGIRDLAMSSSGLTRGSRVIKSGMTVKIRDSSPPAGGPTRNDNQRLFPNLIPELRGVSAQQAMSAIFQGVQAAYKKQFLPYMTVLLPDISEQSIGMYFQWKMLEMIYLGALFGVNAFNQPQVELYKKETKRILTMKTKI